MLLKATMAKDQNTETSKLTKHDFPGSLPANVILNSQLRLTQKILLPQAMKNWIAVEVFYFKARFLSILLPLLVKVRRKLPENTYLYVFYATIKLSTGALVFGLKGSDICIRKSR
jgi:hypothetical protein